MTKYSAPFGTSNIPTEDRAFSFYRKMHEVDGVDGDIANSLKVTQGTGLQVSIAPGEALVRGAIYANDAAELIGPGGWTLPSAGQTRRDRYVVRRSPASDNCDTARLTGTATTGTPADPALTQIESGVWEMSLASVLLNSTGIVSISDQRTILPRGGALEATSTNRPPHKIGRLIYETDLGRVLVSDGSAWRTIHDPAYGVAEKTTDSVVAGGTDIDSTPVTVLSAPAVEVHGDMKITVIWPQVNVNEFVETGAHTFVAGIFRDSTRIALVRYRLEDTSIQQAGGGFPHVDNDPPTGSHVYRLKCAWGGATSCTLEASSQAPIQILVEPFGR